MAVVTGQITSNSSHVDLVSQGEYSLSVSFNGTFTGVAVAFFVSDDGTNFYPMRAFSRTTGTGAATATLADSTKVMYLAWILPGQTFRVQATGFSTGPASVTINSAMYPVPLAA